MKRCARWSGKGLGLVLVLVMLLAACRPTRAFYVVPDELPPQPGDVIRTLQVMFDKSGTYRGTAIMYRSTSATGEPNAVTGTLYVPRTEWTGPGDRPVVSFAPGTQGIGDRCAPSLSLPIGKFYEQGIVRALLDRGWAVAVTDYEKVGPPGDATYVIKDAEAHAVLDIVRAAQNIPDSGVTDQSPVGLWGYSQGGQAASAAAELESTYAPELDVRGVVAGGVPSDLLGMTAHLDGPGNDYFALLAFAALGLNSAYPELQLESYLNETGSSLLADVRSGTGFCLSDSLDVLTLLAGTHIADLTTSNPLETPEWQARVDEQRLGRVIPSIPVYLYHGTNDQIIPLVQGTTLRDDWCAGGADLQFTELPVDHIGGVFTGLTAGATFMEARFAGEPTTPGGCPAG